LVAPSVDVNVFLTFFIAVFYFFFILRSHGMNDDVLQIIYKTVVLSKRLYAASAWWGFTNRGRRARKCGLKRSKGKTRIRVLLGGESWQKL